MTASANHSNVLRHLIPGQERKDVMMGELRIDYPVGSVKREAYHGSLIGPVGRREGPRAGENGQAEAVVEPYDRLGDITCGSGFYRTENKIVESHN